MIVSEVPLLAAQLSLIGAPDRATSSRRSEPLCRESWT
jgi:hypothetical protein